MTEASVAGRPRWGVAVLVGALLLPAACADDPVAPVGDAREREAESGPALAVHLTCTVAVEAGTMSCDPSPSVPVGGPQMNLVVGSQHRFVRMANDTPSVSGGVWSANVTVQNLTLQPFGTLDGTTAEAEGVRVFFVDEPDNGVVVSNYDGQADFTGTGPQKYYEYSGAGLLGVDAILSPGETSAAKNWQFTLNGATEFTFSVLVSTTVPDPNAYGVHLSRVDAGGFHTCGETTDGRIFCWGLNSDGQLGNGTFKGAHTPVEVHRGLLGPLSAVSAGQLHTCAKGDFGGLLCWGLGNSGQLGVSFVPNNWRQPYPGDVDGFITLFSSVAAGAAHTCGVGTDDNLRCWGANNAGQLGNGDTTRTNLFGPDSVHAPPGVDLFDPALGGGHTCASGSDGQLYCWGANYVGQLGKGTPGESLAPVPVSAPAKVKLSRATAGAQHTCAEGDDETVYCWGNNLYGQLGDGTQTHRDAPVAVVAPPDVTLSRPTAGPGGHHTCAQGSDGNVYCWGRNNRGQLGDGTMADRSTPVAVSAPIGVSLFKPSAGGEHSCAVGSNGVTYCWGYNHRGQLGDGTTTDRLTPVPVAGTRAP